MELELFQIDAFASQLFKGNPAAVVPLPYWLDDHEMQQIAMENNLSETVFFVPSPNEGVDYHIRWFTPAVEINLCGHATLAASYVLFHYLSHANAQIVFDSLSGRLQVKKEEDLIWLDFPRWYPERLMQGYEEIVAALGVKEVVGVYQHRDVIIELADEVQVKKCMPDFAALKKTGAKVIITAPGNDGVDFVSRFFGPAVGVEEDPVTGSAHAQLIPFWSEKLGKQKMFARQLSARGGEIHCIDTGERVLMGGNCVFYMRGIISI